MTRNALFTAMLAASFLVPFSAQTTVAQPVADDEQPFTVTTGSQVVRVTTFGSCFNFPFGDCRDCPVDGAFGDSGFKVTEDNKQCPLTYSFGNSVVDNIGLNYIHTACDYHVENDMAPGCSACGTGTVEPSAAATDAGGAMPSFKLTRIHRYRDQPIESSFGPGVFSQFDMRLFLFQAPNSSNLIDVFDPQAFYTQRFADGPYTDPSTGIATTDIQDGVYVSFRTNQTKDIRLFDAGNNLVIPQDQAVRAELLTHEGLRFHFDVFELSGTRVGRLTRIENRNGYAYYIAYQFGVTDAMGRQFQIDTITDAYNRVATFSYHPAQVSGRWVVSQVAFPNGDSADYTYTGGFLSGVAHADGTTTAITKTFDPASDCVVFEFADAAAEGTHRNKRVYLMPSVRYLPTGGDQIIPQSEGMVRMVVNGNGEVSYLNYPSQELIFPLVYEGPGRLKKVDFTPTSIRTRYMKQWSISLSQFGTWYPEGISLTPEPTAEDFQHTAGLAGMFRNEPSRIVDETGRFVDYVYNADNSTISVAMHPDGTQERYEYNQFRQVTLYVDRLNRATEYTYDARGNMLTKTMGRLFDGANVVDPPDTADISTWRWEYFAAGDANQLLLKKSIDANGNRTDYEYDANHFLTMITEPPDDVSDPRAEHLFSYDAAGRLKIATDPVGRQTEFFYDARSRVTQIEYHDGSSEIITYGTGIDANLVVQRTDRNGNATTFEYDATGRLVRETEAVNDPAISVETVCTYVGGTNLRAACTDKGETSTYAYDYRHRNVASTSQPRVDTLLTTRRTYENNELRSTEDPYGRRTFYVYDPIDQYLIRTIRETVPGGVSAGADLATLARDASPNAPYIIEDRYVDAENQLLTRTDGRGIQHTFQYDSQGRTRDEIIAASAPAVSAHTHYDYDAQGNLIRQLHPRHFTESDDFITEFTYSGRNLLKTRTEAVGRDEEATMSHAYYLDQRAKDTIDYRGNTWTTLWHACCGRFQGTIEPNADHSGAISNTDFHGNVTHTAVVTDITGQDYHDPDGALNEVTTRYDARHRPVARTVWLVELGAVDPNAVPIAGENGVPEADGLTTRFVYDDDLTDGLGIDAAYAGYLAPLGLGAGSDGSGVRMINPEIESTVSLYDGMGRAVMVIDGNGNARRTDYDSIVNVSGVGDVVESASVDPLGHVSRGRTDGAGRVVEAVDEEGQVTCFTYDANSNRLSVRDPNGVGEDCMYDARNRDITCTDTQGDSTGKQYDGHSNVTAYIDGYGNQTICTLDGRDRKLTSTTRVGGVTTYSYDDNSNVESITDGDGGTTSYVYDERNLKIRETFADDMPGLERGVIDYSYDGARRLTGRLDQNNDLTAYVYDGANRLLRREYPDALNDVFAYDRASRLLSATSNRYANTIMRAYDDASRLTSERMDIEGESYTVGYQYDADDRKTHITYPDGSVVTRAYTPRDQLDAVKLDGSDVIDCMYDPGMRLVNTAYGNGLVETRTYRPDNTVETIRVPGVTDFTYAYDANKRRTAETNGVHADMSQTYGYDAEDRLESWNRVAGASQTWDFSLVGDWDTTTVDGTPETRTHNGVHELTAIDVAPLSYDLKGNLTQDADGKQFAWDFDNQLKHAIVGGDTSFYAYDALGRRVRKEARGLITHFVCDGAQIIAEYERPIASVPDQNCDGALDMLDIEPFVLALTDPNAHAAAYPQCAIALADVNRDGLSNGLDIALFVECLLQTPHPCSVLSNQFTMARSFAYARRIDDACVMRNATHSEFFYHHDANYSIRALTNYSGAVLERYLYAAYGRPKVSVGNGNPSAQSVAGNPLMFQGGYLDVETTLNYKTVRYYSTSLGRFISRDPMGGWHDSWNLGSSYQFVGGNPIVRRDPLAARGESLFFALGDHHGRSGSSRDFAVYLPSPGAVGRVCSARTARRPRLMPSGAPRGPASPAPCPRRAGRAESGSD